METPPSSSQVAGLYSVSPARVGRQLPAPSDMHSTALFWRGRQPAAIPLQAEAADSAAKYSLHLLSSLLRPPQHACLISSLSVSPAPPNNVAANPTTDMSAQGRIHSESQSGPRTGSRQTRTDCIFVGWPCHCACQESKAPASANSGSLRDDTFTET